MREVSEIPVVLILFNRPECLTRVVDALRPVRPKRLFVVADGPRPDHAGDVEACRRARAVIDTIDWPADLRWRAAKVNLGCDRSVPEGLDWVFDQVAEAVILEDDVVPAAGFLPWCASMLERYRGTSDISHISGRNGLGVWPTGGADHLLAHRTSLWGWATWASAWKEVRAACIAAADRAPIELHPDPLVAQDLAFVHDLVRRDRFVTWDAIWSLGAALTGKLAVLPPTNLISNIGFRPDATHNDFVGDFRASLPTGAAPAPAPGPRPLPDAGFDRWALLTGLLAAYRDDPRITRLARARHLVRDPRLRLHLAPFDDLEEASAVLRHLAAIGTRSPHLDAVLARLESAKAAAAKRPPPSLAVVMPVLNAAPFLAAAIESVLTQLPSGIDLVVVDGGSTDGSIAIAAGFPRARLLMQSGRGLAAARNQGLRAVDAEFVGFCDADDRWAEGALAVRLAHLQSQPACDAVIGQVSGEVRAGEPLTPQQEARLGQPLPGFTPGALLARRHVFQRIGPFDETLTIGADSDWFVRLQQSELRLAELSTIVLRKGARAASLSTDRETYRRELLGVARKFLKRRRAGRG